MFVHKNSILIHFSSLDFGRVKHRFSLNRFLIFLLDRKGSAVDRDLFFQYKQTLVFLKFAVYFKIFVGEEF